jgi:hypothetical protein
MELPLEIVRVKSLSKKKLLLLARKLMSRWYPS